MTATAHQQQDFDYLPNQDGMSELEPEKQGWDLSYGPFSEGRITEEIKGFKNRRLKLYGERITIYS